MSEVGEQLAPVTRTVLARDIVMGAAASRDWQPQHHDVAYAREMNLPDVIMNAPTQTGWFHAYAMAWAGEGARIARWKLKMRRSICPGAQVTLTGEVTQVESAWTEAEWVWLELRISGAEEQLSSMQLLLARPIELDRTCWVIPANQWVVPSLVR